MKVREGFAESSGQGEGDVGGEGGQEERSFPERRRPIEKLKNSLACMSNLYSLSRILPFSSRALHLRFSRSFHV